MHFQGILDGIVRVVSRFGYEQSPAYASQQLVTGMEKLVAAKADASMTAKVA